MLTFACFAFAVSTVQAGAQKPLPLHPLTVHRMDTASLRKFVVSSGTGKDAKLAFTLSAATPMIANRGLLSCLNCSSRPEYPSIEFDPMFGDNYKGGDYRQLSLGLQGLTQGNQYLVVVNMTCQNLGAYINYDLSSKKETALEGDVNLPIVVKAMSNTEWVNIQFFRDHASKVGWTSISSIDVHQIS